MSTVWLWLAMFGLGGFLTGLATAAWCGQTPAGRWRPGAWRALAVASAGLVLLLLALGRMGAPRTGLEYPHIEPWETPAKLGEKR